MLNHARRGTNCAKVSGKSSSQLNGVSIALALSALIVGTQTAHGQAVPPNEQGKPNLHGIWQALNTAAWDLQDHSGRLGVPAGQGVVEGNEIPYQPWAVEQKKANAAASVTADPVAKCYMPGVPRATYMGFPFQIFQTSKYVSILYEYAHTYRVIYMDGSKHPEGIDFWMGDSRGRWEGDTLVVDVTNFNGQTWLDRAGNFHSNALHVVERYTPQGRDHLQYEVTFEDPKVFTRPWKISMVLYRRKDPGVQILEYECPSYLDEAGGRDGAVWNPAR